MNKNLYDLRKLKELVEGFNQTESIEREILLCITSLLSNNNCSIGEMIDLDGEYYLLGYRGLIDIYGAIVEYEKIGFVYLTENVKKLSEKDAKKDITDDEIIERMNNTLRNEFVKLVHIRRLNSSPNLDNVDKNQIINVKDEQLAYLHDKYESTLEHIDKLSDFIVKQSRELKKLNKKVK